MHVVHGFPGGLTLMNHQRLAAISVAQRERPGKHIYGIGKGMRVPRQGGMRRESHLDSGELGLSLWVVLVRLPVPGLRGL